MRFVSADSRLRYLPKEVSLHTQMEHRSNYAYLKSLLILLVVWQCSEIADSTPPKISSFTYRSKTLELLDQTIDSNIITLELDQDVYHEVQCPNEFSASNRSRYIRCCNPDSPASDCYSPPRSNQQCLDGNNTHINGTAAANDYQTYSFKIENYQTCHSISVLMKVLSGQIFLAASIRQEFQAVSTTVNDFLRAELGSNGLSLCCNEIRALNPAWNGEVYIGWQPLVATEYEFSIWTDYILPVTEFYMIPPIDIKCDEFHFTPDDCRERSGCFPTPATDDPMFSLLASIGGLVKYEANSKALSTGIITRRELLRGIPSVAFPFPEKRFGDSSCKFTFPTLVNSRSEPLENSIGNPIEKIVPCDRNSFNSTLTAFRTQIAALGNILPSSINEANMYYFRAISWCIADQWTSCTETVENNLLYTVSRQTTLNNSRACLETSQSDTYLNDPCCNPILQITTCCSGRDVTAVIDGFEVNANSVNDQCRTPRCLSNVLNDYMTLSASNTDRRTGCSAKSTEALSSVTSRIGALSSCLRAINGTTCLSNNVCRNQDASSVCLPSGLCSIPCIIDLDCITNACELVSTGTRNVTSCRILDFSDVENLSPEVGMSVTWDCIQRNVDPLSILFIKQDLGLYTATTHNEVIQLLVNGSGAIPSCIGPLDVPVELCDTVRTCNWAACNSTTDPYCNLQNCTDPNLGSDYFCGLCQSGLCSEVSSFARCEYRTSSSTECRDVGGSYNGISSGTLVSPKCIRPAATVAQCYPPEFCTSTTSCTISRCYYPDIVTQENCTATTIGTPLSWTSWTVGIQTYGLCTASFSSYAGCSSDPELRWWPGTTWTYGLFDSQEFCETYGFCGTLSIVTQSSCDTQFTCSDGLSTEKEICESQGSCDDFTGCVIPWDSVDFRCPTSHDWTPLGCRSYSISDEIACAEQGGQWLTPAQTKQDCESKAMICRESARVASNGMPAPRTQMNYFESLKDEEECSACGGAFGPYFSWSGGEWLPVKYVPFQWKRREFKPANALVPIPSYDYFVTLTSASLARRYAQLLESELLCRFSQTSSFLSTIVCDCTSGDNDAFCFQDVSSSVISTGLACSFIETDVATSETATIKTMHDFVTSDFDCISVRVNVIPSSQFTIEQTSSLSASAIFSVKSQQQRSILYVRNAANVVVGRIVSDGIQVSREPIDISGTLQVCLTFPMVPETTQQSGAEYRWASPNDDFSAITLHDFTVSPNETTCLPFVNITQTYFAVVLQEGWETALFIETLLPEEVAVMFLGVGLYSAVLILVLIFAVKNIKILLASRKKITELRMGGFLLLAIALLLRLIFLFVLPFGSFESVRYSDIVFSELPALIFLMCYAVVVYQCGVGKGHKRLKFVFIAFISLLILAFILIVIIFSLVDSPLSNRCFSTIDAFDPAKIVAIVYKAFFALVCIGLSIVFAIYGTKIVRMSNSFKVVPLNQEESRMINKKKIEVKRKIAFNVIGSICLLGQAANLLQSSIAGNSSVYTLFFVFVVELIPGVIFCFIFKENNSRVNRDHTTSKKKYGTITTKNYLYKAIPSHDISPVSESELDIKVDVDIPYDQIKIDQQIGEGNYGQVLRGSWNNIPVAIKVSKGDSTEIIHEAQIAKSFPVHANVVQTFGLSRNGSQSMLVMEFCNGNSLDKILFDLPEVIEEKQKLSIIRHIAGGMAHLHQNRIIHRDLAARNILFNKDVPKISDFGMSEKVEDIYQQHIVDNLVGPIRWMAPEALRGVYNSKTDIWSFGILVYEITCQSEPHVNEDPLFVGLKIRDQAYTPKIPSDCSSPLKQLMQQCWQADPSQRPASLIQIITNERY